MLTKLAGSIIISGLFLVATTGTIHAGNAKQAAKKKQDLTVLTAQVDKYTKITKTLALVTEKIFVYYETIFLTGDRKQSYFNFSDIREYAGKVVETEKELEKGMSKDIEANYTAGIERMNARDAADIMDLIAITKTVIWHTHVMADLGNTEHKDANKWIAEAGGNDKLLAKYVLLAKEEMKKLCKNLFNNKCKAVIKSLANKEEDLEVKRELANLLLKAENEL